MAIAPGKPKSRRLLLAWMILSQLLMAASLVLWLLFAGLSVMAFDSGATREAWTFVLAVWAYPLIPILLVVGAWVAYGRHKNALAAILSGLSFVPPALLYAFLAVSSAVWSA